MSRTRVRIKLESHLESLYWLDTNKRTREYCNPHVIATVSVTGFPDRPADEQEALLFAEEDDARFALETATESSCQALVQYRPPVNDFSVRQFSLNLFCLAA